MSQELNITQLSVNSCKIITILPLNLECNSINATTPKSTNGLITLFITGGTPPYYISWENGSQGTTLTNLSPGDYTATVVDYYGDFTETITCTVGYDTFYLEVLENCKPPNNYIYYLADLTNTLINGLIYQLTTQVGCWISNGITTHTGQTYIENFPIYSEGPFIDCTDCLPPPEPTPVYPTDLCLELNIDSSISQDTFILGNTINGYPSWDSVSNQTIYYNTGTTQWTVSGWTYEGSVFLQLPTTTPIGNWTLTGPLAYNSSVYVSSGICQTPQLTMNVNITNPTCSTNNNGTIEITPNGGMSPYMYSIDSVNYVNSNTFVGFPVGTYTVYVKDINNTIINQTVTLIPQQVFQNYNVSLIVTPQQPITVNNTITKTSNWSINVSPYPLPVGTIIDMDLLFNVSTSATTFTLPQQEQVSYYNNIYYNPPTGDFTISAPTITAINGSSYINVSCTAQTKNFSSHTKNYTVQLSEYGTITGKIVQSITTPCSPKPGCNLFANIKNVVSIQNITITPTLCQSVNSFSLPNQVNLTKTGLICPGI